MENASTRSDHSAPKRKLAAILSADVVGYSRLMGDDERATLETLNAYRQIMRDRITEHGGRVIDSPGDALLAEFSSPVEAVRAAVEIQRDLAQRNALLPEARKMQVRLGLNLGDVIEEDGALYGDGVNVAARLQALASAGGICVSAAVFDQVQGKLPLQFKFIGEQHVKNIARAVKAYQVLLQPAVSERRTERLLEGFGQRKLMGIALVVLLVALAVGILMMPGDKNHREVLGRPSVAVLPFINLSGDRDQEYFADGLTEDIITNLAHFRELFVIARNSTSAYKGQAINVQEVAQRLSVRYVLEGSVRRTNDRVRITAQLIDAVTETHIWAHAYDEPLEKLFAVQDEVTSELVGALGISIRDAEKQRNLRKATEDLNAYDLIMRAGQLWAEGSPAEHLQLRNLTERAVALDPGYGRAQAMLAFAYLDEYRWKFNPHPHRPDPLKSARERAELAVRLDPADAYTHYALAKIAYFSKELNVAEREFSKTFALNASAADPRADWGVRLAVMGRPDEGIALTREAIRLNPTYPGWYHFALAADALYKGDFSRAVAESESIGLRQLFWTQIFLCASYAHSGRMEQAHAAGRELLKLYPRIENDWDNQTTGLHSWNSKFKEIVEQGLRKAGLFSQEKLTSAGMSSS